MEKIYIQSIESEFMYRIIKITVFIRVLHMVLNIMEILTFVNVWNGDLGIRFYSACLFKTYNFAIILR